MREYRKRVDYLYNICKKNGLDVDTQNRNPSRLSRMPGVIRNVSAENVRIRAARDGRLSLMAKPLKSIRNIPAVSVIVCAIQSILREKVLSSMTEDVLS